MKRWPKLLASTTPPERLAGDHERCTSIELDKPPRITALSGAKACWINRVFGRQTDSLALCLNQPMIIGRTSQSQGP